jgi:ubiquinone/menaquinone biosynthesis C-methylase UbiE
MLGSTERFSSRVENYVRYRPDYPVAVIDLLRAKCGLGPGSIVADVGSGTGILTELLLKTGAEVFAVEPNHDMRAAADRLLGTYTRFRSVDGTAEATTLAPASVDLVVAGQAFHWFDVQRARREMIRVLKPGGWVALIWNERPRVTTPFLADYEALLRRHAAEYDPIQSRRNAQTGIHEFFGGEPELATFPNQQTFDFEGLEGRLMSSSYAPEPGHAEHEPMIAGLQELFLRHQHNGQVIFPYETLVYFGQLG